jgi:hypothetical protein
MTFADLKLQYGNTYMERITGHFSNILFVNNKPIINSFSEFDTQTKNIYLQIYSVLSAYNTEPFQLYATGSRINGTWKTNQEVDDFAANHGGIAKYSDYDFVTTAKIIPPYSEFFSKVDGPTDMIGGSDRKILVEP